MASEHSTRAERLSLLGIVVVGALLRLSGLATLPFEQDELYTVRDAMDFGASSSGPGISARPLYYLVQHMLFQVLPGEPLAVRALPWVLGVLGLVATWRVANQIFGRPAGLLAMALVAVSPWHLYASQFARYWSAVYLLSVLATGFLWQALRTDAPRAWWGVALTCALGVLTHPTFAFPVVGVVLALHVVDDAGRLGWRWPTRTAWLAGWIPAALLAGTTLLIVRLLLPVGLYGNGTGRGLGETVRVFAGIVQWFGVVPMTVAGVSLLGCLGSRMHRRWGVGALAGSVSTLALLAVSGVGNDIYADYAMAMLPLLFISIGGGIALMAAALPTAWQTKAQVGVLVVLVAASVPDAVSHLSDGTRFDYRPLFAQIRETPERAPVLAWPLIVARYYARDLDPIELQGSAAQLEGQLAHGGFWVVASVARQGMAPDDGTARAWLDRHCRTEMVVERPRFDYRNYRAELRWCGPDRTASTRS